jgi:hypothetical protein
MSWHQIKKQIPKFTDLTPPLHLSDLFDRPRLAPGMMGVSICFPLQSASASSRISPIPHLHFSQYESG